MIWHFHFLEAIQVEDEKIIKFKDLSEDMVNYKLTGFKSFEDYKKSMKNDFMKNAKRYHEEFTDESLISYETLKVIEKF